MGVLFRYYFRIRSKVTFFRMNGEIKFTIIENKKCPV